MGECYSGVVSNNSQCKITRTRAIARARSRKVSYAGVYLFLGLGLGLIISTSRANLVLRVIWQRDIFGTTHRYSENEQSACTRGWWAGVLKRVTSAACQTASATDATARLSVCLSRYGTCSLTGVTSVERVEVSL